MPEPDNPGDDGRGPDSLDGSSSLDWGWRPRGRTVGCALGLLLWAGLYLYSQVAVQPGEPVAFGVVLHPIDWPFGVALLLVGWYLVVPLARNRRFARRYWRHVRRNRLALGASVVLAAFVVVGLFGPLVVDVLEAAFDITKTQGQEAAALQPPLGVAVPVDVVETCTGRVAHGACHGSIYHPFGTGDYGDDILEGVVAGTRVALAVSLTTAVFVAPVAVGVGVTAAYIGGWVDDALMRAAELLDVVPAVFVYVIVQVPLQRNLWLVVVVFGVLSWGHTARLVRSDALAMLKSGYVAAAEAAGAGPLYVIRNHVVPGVAGTVVTAMSFFVPTMILVEVTLGWLNLSSGYVHSWGDELGIRTAAYAGTFPRDGIPVATWWTEAFTLAAIFLTVASFYLVGDALRDILDPRTEP